MFLSFDTSSTNKNGCLLRAAVCLYFGPFRKSLADNSSGSPEPATMMSSLSDASPREIATVGNRLSAHTEQPDAQVRQYPESLQGRQVEPYYSSMR